MMIEYQKDWGWYVGLDDEVYTVGPVGESEAVRIASEEYNGAHICEAHKAPVNLSDMFDAHGWIDDCEDRAWEDFVGENGDILFDVNPDDLNSLQDAVRSAIDKWQTDRGLIFNPFMFTEVRNQEYIPASTESHKQ